MDDGGFEVRQVPAEQHADPGLRGQEHGWSAALQPPRLEPNQTTSADGAEVTVHEFAILDAAAGGTITISVTDPGPPDSEETVAIEYTPDVTADSIEQTLRDHEWDFADLDTEQILVEPVGEGFRIHFPAEVVIEVTVTNLQPRQVASDKKVRDGVPAVVTALT